MRNRPSRTCPAHMQAAHATGMSARHSDTRLRHGYYRSLVLVPSNTRRILRTLLPLRRFLRRLLKLGPTVDLPATRTLRPQPDAHQVRSIALRRMNERQARRREKPVRSMRTRVTEGAHPSERSPKLLVCHKI